MTHVQLTSPSGRAVLLRIDSILLVEDVMHHPAGWCVCVTWEDSAGDRSVTHVRDTVEQVAGAIDRAQGKGTR